MAEYNELLTTQIGLVSSLARVIEIIHKSGRYGAIPTSEWITEITKSGRYGAKG